MIIANNGILKFSQKFLNPVHDLGFDLEMNEKNMKEHYYENMDSILNSKHFTDRDESIKSLFKEVVNSVWDEFQNEISQIEVSFNKSYIGFYRVIKPNLRRLFMTIRVKKDKITKENMFHASLKVDNPQKRDEYKLDLSRKTNRKDEGDFDFRNMEKFGSKIGALRYSFDSCFEK